MSSFISYVWTSWVVCSLTENDHRLRGNASPVLTATGFVNGKGQSPPPTESTHLNWSPKICHRWLRRRPLQLYQIRSISVHGGGFWAHKWNITKIICIYAPFWEFTYRSDPSTDFHVWWLKLRGLAQGCAFLKIYTHCFSFRGQEPPKPPILELEYKWIGVFKPNSRKRKTCIFSKLLHRFQPNFAQW